VTSRDRGRSGLGSVLAEITTPREDGVHPLWAAVGGVRGIIDSSLPTTAFVIANIFGGLKTAILVALGVSAVLLLIRVVRRESPQQAFAGLIAVGAASLVANRLHSASGFFLIGTLLQIPYAVAALGSVVVRRPLVGYVAAIVNPSLANWRKIPVLRRAAAYATLVWAMVFLTRIAVMVPLYLADESSGLGVAKLAMGWPLWALATGISLLLIRNAAARVDQSVTGGPEADSDLPS
jgi:hypothetical protein